MQIIERWNTGFQLIFSRPKYRLLAMVLFLIFLPVYAVLTGIILLLPLSFNPNLKPIEAGLIAIVALFVSLGFTIAAFQLFEFRSVSKKTLGGSVFGAGAGGGVLAAFATSCAFCQPIWLLWLGVGGAASFLVEYSLPIALASIVLLIISLNAGFKAVVEGCNAKIIRQVRRI